MRSSTQFKSLKSELTIFDDQIQISDSIRRRPFVSGTLIPLAYTGTNARKGRKPNKLNLNQFLAIKYEYLVTLVVIENAAAWLNYSDKKPKQRPYGLALEF